MLILSRSAGETIDISYDGVLICTLKVSEIRGPKVKLGFEADRRVTIHRSEVTERIRAMTGEPPAQLVHPALQPA